MNSEALYRNTSLLALICHLRECPHIPFRKESRFYKHNTSSVCSISDECQILPIGTHSNTKEKQLTIAQAVY